MPIRDCAAAIARGLRGPHASSMYAISRMLPAVVALAFGTVPRALAQGESAAAAWARSAVHADVCLGGAQALRTRLLFYPTLFTSGDPEAGAAFFEKWTRRCDDEAARAVAQRVEPSLWKDVRSFYASRAGHALRRAETAVLAAAPDLSDFWRVAESHFADPERVGVRAVQKLAELQQEAASNSGTIDPATASGLAAASLLLESDARAIGEFLRSDAGRAWQEVRAVAWPEARARIEACIAEGVALGLLWELGQLPATLPKGQPHDAQDADDRDRITVDVLCLEPGELVEAMDPATGAVKKVASADAKGRVVGWRVDGLECRDEAAFRKAVAARIAAHTAAVPAGREPVALRATLAPQAGTFYADLARTTQLLEQLGVGVAEFRFPAAGDGSTPPRAR